MKKYYNTTFSSYRKWTKMTRWSQKQDTSIVYDSKKCAIRKSSVKYDQTTQAVQTDINWYTMNVESTYSNILLWDIVLINSEQYKVSNNPIPHEKANGNIDYYEIYITKTTPVTL